MSQSPTVTNVAIQRPINKDISLRREQDVLDPPHQSFSESPSPQKIKEKISVHQIEGFCEVNFQNMSRHSVLMQSKDQFFSNGYVIKDTSSFQKSILVRVYKRVHDLVQPVSKHFRKYFQRGIDKADRTIIPWRLKRFNFGDESDASPVNSF